MEAQLASVYADRTAGRRRIASVREWTSATTPAGWLWLAVVVFIGVTIWWLTQDNRAIVWDAGNHMNIAYDDGLALRAGQFWVPFTVYTTYPPLVHLVGAVSYLLVGMHPMAMTVAANLVFVPLLAFGCYGVGRITAGPRAGLLAGVFGLCMPMVVSMMHSFMVDTPQAAMVAVSVWAILASQKFERKGVSAAAGALCGLAMLTKETSVVFLAGILLAVFARGGWRQWRGLLCFGAAVGVVAGPWYVYHWSEITQTFTSIGQLNAGSLQSPPRASIRNFSWYFWNLINEQAGLVFTIVFVIGTVIAVVRTVRDRASSASVLPELLVGGLISYLGMSYLTHKDPRYDLPALVYIAVLATFWLPGLRSRLWRRAAIGAVLAMALINFTGMSLGIGHNTRIAISIPGAQTNILYTWQLTVYQDQGWLRGGPAHDDDVLGLLRGLRRQGITQAGIAADELDFSMLGLLPYADVVGIDLSGESTQTAHSAFLLLHLTVPGDPAPCGRLNAGEGIYIVRGPVAGLDPNTLRSATNPAQPHVFICPGRPAVSWPATRG